MPSSILLVSVVSRLPTKFLIGTINDIASYQTTSYYIKMLMISLIIKIFLVPLICIAFVLTGEILCGKELRKHSLRHSIFIYNFKFYVAYRFLKGKKNLPLTPILVEIIGLAVLLVWFLLLYNWYSS